MFHVQFAFDQVLLLSLSHTCLTIIQQINKETFSSARFSPTPVSAVAVCLQKTFNSPLRKLCQFHYPSSANVLPFSKCGNENSVSCVLGCCWSLWRTESDLLLFVAAGAAVIMQMLQGVGWKVSASLLHFSFLLCREIPVSGRRACLHVWYCLFHSWRALNWNTASDLAGERQAY